MACVSLWLAASANLAGCLVTSTEPVEPPVKTPPYLVAHLADPPLNKIVLIEAESRVTFSAPVHSEDFDDDLESVLLVDLDLDQSPDAGPGNLPTFGKRIAAGTFHVPREVSVTFNESPYDLTIGCHTITMLVSHEIDPETYQPIDPSDRSILVWWMSKFDPATGEYPMTGCPSAPPSGDAGIQSGPDGGL